MTPYDPPHLRGLVGAWTGSGFLVAIYALMLRAHRAFLVTLPGGYPGWWKDRFAADHGLIERVRVVRWMGYVGLALGLGLVVAAILAERWTRRHAPDWAVFSD